MRKGWEECFIEDNIKLIDYRGRTPIKTEAGVRLITAKNVKLGYLQLEPQEFINADNYEAWMSRGIPNFGDVIFTTEAPLGNVAQIDTEEKLAFAQRIIVMQPKATKLDQTFLKYMLLSENMRRKILGQGTGATVQGIKSSLLKKIKISFPPLPEQQRIVSILDEAFAAIATAKANAEQNLKNAKELFESVKKQIFIELSQVNKAKPIASVCKEIFAGGDAPKGNFSTERTEQYNIPIIANAAKDNGLYGYTDLTRVSDPSITIAARGSGTGLTEIRYDPFFPIVRLIVLTPNLEKVTLEFLKFSIQNLDILSSGSAIPQLTIPMIKEYSIALPQIEDQKNISEKLDALSIETKRLEAIYRQKIEDLEELKKVILQKAFSGELKNKLAVV